MLFITAMIKEVCTAVCFVFLKDLGCFPRIGINFAWACTCAVCQGGEWSSTYLFRQLLLIASDLVFGETSFHKSSFPSRGFLVLSSHL